MGITVGSNGSDAVSLRSFSFLCDQPVHTSGSSGYSSLPRTDHILSMTSSSEDNCCGGKMPEQEEEACSKSRPVSRWRRVVSPFLGNSRALPEPVSERGLLFPRFLSAPSRKSVREFISRRTKSSRQTRQTTRRTAVRSAQNSTCVPSLRCLHVLTTAPPRRGGRQESCSGAAQRLGSAPKPQGARGPRGGEQALLCPGDDLQRANHLLLPADQLSGQCCQVM